VRLSLNCAKQRKNASHFLGYKQKGFKADEVEEFYRWAIYGGARNNISPRARAASSPGDHAADVFDLDGYSFEAVKKLAAEDRIAKAVTATAIGSPCGPRLGLTCRSNVVR
jgi:hypothetical protein